MRALTHAHRITDTTLAAATQSFSTAAENTGLLAAMSCNHLGGPLGCPGPLTEPAANNGSGTWDWSPVGGIFTINRSLNAAVVHARPHASARRRRSPASAISCTPRPRARRSRRSRARSQRSFAGSDGIRDVHIIDHAATSSATTGTTRSGVYPPAQLAQSDFAQLQRGLAPRRRTTSTRSARAGARARTRSDGASTPYAEIDNPNAFSEPTIQFYSNRVESDDPAVSFYGTAKKAQAAGSPSTSIGSSAGHPERRPGRLGLR